MTRRKRRAKAERPGRRAAKTVTSCAALGVAVVLQASGCDEADPPRIYDIMSVPYDRSRPTIYDIMSVPRLDGPRDARPDRPYAILPPAKDAGLDARLDREPKKDGGK